MSISVVIPTRDRPSNLRRCLEALATQTGERLEVIVVDDGSRDRRALSEAVTAAEPAARILRAGGHGPATARNLGWRAATGDIVLFTDDDCEPAAQWASRIAPAASEAGVAAGRTVLAPHAGASAAAAQVITNHLQTASLDRADGRLGFAPTSNLAVRRELLARMPFDEAFPQAAGEDRDFSARAKAAGSGALYVPEAIVVHSPDLRLRGFIRQQYRYGRGAARFRATADDRGLAGPGFYTGLARAGFAQGPVTGVLVLAAQGATAAGVLAERAQRRDALRAR